MSPRMHVHMLVVDDHPLFRQGLFATLAQHVPELILAGARSMREALDALRTETDLVLADYRLPDGDGLTLLGLVGERLPTAGRVLISGLDDPHLPLRCRQAGLLGYLPKNMEPAAIVAALRHILAGESYFPGRADLAAAFTLTKRQAEILKWVALGLSNREIAQELHIAERTVKDHLALIFERLDAGNRAEAIARAASRGLLSGD